MEEFSKVTTTTITAADVYTDIFSGFILYLGVLVLSIIILIIRSKAKENPTIGKRNALITLSSIVTVADALLLIFKVNFIEFLFNPYTFFTKNKFLMYSSVGVVTQTIYIIMYIVIIAIIIFGIIAFILGFKAAKAKNFPELCQPDYPMQVYQAIPGITPGFNPGISSDIGVKCECGKINHQGAAFCSECGKPLNGFSSPQQPTAATQSGDVPEPENH